jgi:CCR4-NOT transcription complex subunit 6
MEPAGAPAFYTRTPKRVGTAAFAGRTQADVGDRGPEPGAAPVHQGGVAGGSTGTPTLTGAADGAGTNVEGASTGATGALGWSVLDCSNNTLRNLSPALFAYTFLTGLRLSNNQLVSLPAAVGRLKNLATLDLTGNRLATLPMELGLCHRLRKLLLYNNQLHSLPWELGMLYQLELLGLDGNPIVEPLNTLKEDGATAVVHYLRDHAPCA